MIDLDYAGGFAFFIKREVWERCGGFDKNLANYGNEVELCRRLKREGHRVVWTRASYVHHFGEASFILHFTTGQLSGQRKAATQYIEAKHGNTQNQTPHNE